MRNATTLIATVLLLLATSACNKAQSPAQVQDATAAATASAAHENARADATQADVAAAANKDIDAVNRSADKKVATAATSAAVTEAEGKHKIAMAKCKALAGDMQTACEQEADAALATSKAKAGA
jgi:hypothetical protein